MALKIPDFSDEKMVGAPIPASSPSIEISSSTVGKTVDVVGVILGGEKTVPETTLQEIHVTPDELKKEVLEAVDKIDPSRRGEVAKKLDECRGMPKSKKTLTPLPTLTLYRGLRPDQLAEMLLNKSAGNRKENKEAGKPTEIEAKTQVGTAGEEGGPDKLPEFTANYNVAKKWFGVGKIVTAFQIDKKYLKQGSNATEGQTYVCYQNAPATLIGWNPGAPRIEVQSSYSGGLERDVKKINQKEEKK